MDAVPRTTLAQKMDALSSQANIAGYKSVIMAANELGKIFPLMMTAAGTIQPAKVVIMGAGVAGLQALGTAKRLGAIVEVSDIRPAVKEEVESLGGRFIEVETDENMQDEGGYAKEASEEFLKKQKELIFKHVTNADIVITTALVPGKKAPLIGGCPIPIPFGDNQGSAHRDVFEGLDKECLLYSFPTPPVLLNQLPL